MMVTDCGACGKPTGWLFGAQFSNKEQHVIICSDCWDKGQRCWFDGNKLIVSDKQPEKCKQAVLYWDEGLFTTKGEDIVITEDGCYATYPSKDQPSFVRKINPQPTEMIQYDR